MKCPKCQFEYPEGMKFCGECGAKLDKPCPACGHSNPPQFKFCCECGQSLSSPAFLTSKGLSFDEKIEKIQRYLPKGLTDKILSQRDKIEGERKQVTVLFCDMEGFSSLTERLGPEDAYSVMDQVYEILIHKVHDYEGTVNEMTGDGVMALFGVPIALEDAPQRAIRVAMAIHREMAKLGDRMKEEKEGVSGLKMRVGIHTGPVVVGTLGNDLRVEFKAVGETVNLASRMEKLAEAGTTYVTQDTFKLTEGFFRFESIGQKIIKGKKEPVNVYRVIAPSSRRTRFDVSAERGLTPFVGRSRELDLLMDGFERVTAGKGQVFSIVSEAGCGKSRLLYEFRKAVASANATFLEGKCLSYSRGVAYHPHIDILKSSFDIQEAEGDEQIREKVSNGLKMLGADEVKTLPYLLELLSVKDSGIDQISISPEAKKDKIAEAIKRIVLKASEFRPVIIAIEDLHWVDKSSAEITRTLLDSIPGSRVMLILTYRPDFVNPWDAKSFHNQLTLHRLPNRESLEMVTHILGTKEIEKDLGILILEKSEGVPFFIEEFIRSLRDLNIIERRHDLYHLSKDPTSVMIPSTIQDVIMARVDSLPESARELVQTGSAIEREFSYPLIKNVSSLAEEDLLDLLSVLKDSELIYERGIWPKSTFVFKHALTREVVYDSILTSKKRRLHERIGLAIEALYNGQVEEHSEILAAHFSACENYEKAAKYCKLAAKKCEKTGSLRDAIEHARKWIIMLESMHRNDDIEKEIIKARVTLGLYYSQILDFSSAKDSVDPIVEAAAEGDDRRRLSQIHTIMGAYALFMEDDIETACGHLGDALRISEEIQDVVSLLMGNYWMAVALSYNCDFNKAFSLFKEALRINEAANSLWGISIMQSSISYFVHHFRGDMDESHRVSREAVHLAEKSDDSISKAMAYASHGSACYGRGSLEQAIEYLTRATEACERASMSSWNASVHFCLGETFFDLGRYEKSMTFYEKAILILEENRMFPSWRNLNRLALYRAKARHGERDIDPQPFYDYVAANRIPLCEGPMARYIGEILVAIDDRNASEAEGWVQRAILADHRNGLMLHLGRDFRFQAELLSRKGEKLAAMEVMKKSTEIFRSSCAQRDLQEAQKTMATYR